MFKTEGFKEEARMVGMRQKMVAEIKDKGITDQRVLQAMQLVPRQLFFPLDFEQFVYRDAPFPIGFGQTISQPYTVAYQTQLLRIKPGSKVLEIGTGSGYQAAVLSAMGAKVYSVEVVKDLLLQAQKVLNNIDSEIKLFVGDGSVGLESEAPFDAILVTAGAPDVPENLIKQLNIGGVLVIPVGRSKETQKMLRITRISESETKTEDFGNFRFVPLIGKQGWKV